MRTTIGLDIGGTKIAGAVVDRSGEVVLTGRRDTPAQDSPAIAAAAAELVAELAARLPAGDDVAAVGVACAGFIDKTGSHVLFAPNLAWRDEPLKDLLQTTVGLPVIIENDANAAAWGEFTHGSAKEATDMVLVTVGTGIGGGVVIDGRLLRGAYGIAAELGHMRVVPDGHRCGCGNRGCWEQYASGNALVREARELVASGSPLAERLSQLCDGKPKLLKGQHVTQAAAEGDTVAVELLADLGRWVGEGAASVAAILDPELIVLGGGVAAAGPLLLEPAEAAFHRQLTGRGHRPEAAFALATLGNDAGMIGAADLAWQVAAG
ncbi:MAG TPA: ROK family glucokinase [Dermatophilaceae bacterium]|nr:ROK family glucokinase [Dermatophilaceae bacterium]